VKVHAKIAIQASDKRFSAGKRITLTAIVYPGTTAGGTVTFQQWNAKSKHWRTISSAKLALKGGPAKASVSWKPGKGSRKVRVRYAGGTTNIATSSSPILITVK